MQPQVPPDSPQVTPAIARSAVNARAIVVLATLLSACEQRASISPRSTDDSMKAATVVSVPPPTSDSAATIALFESRVAAIEADTIVMEQTQKPITLGAGSTGLLTAWRAGPVWRRLRVEGEGTGFRTLDNYWLSDGVFLGARLEVSRPGRRPAVDEIWFHDRELYRWIDPGGRHLDPAARSTQLEVRMMMTRLDRLLRVLTADDAIRTPAR